MQMKHYPTIDLEATGRQILRLRKARGLSVRDLQTYFGFDAPQAIYKWQKGLTLPSVDNLYALSILLEVPMNTILVQVERPRLERQDISCRPVFFVLEGFACSPLRFWRGWRKIERTDSTVGVNGIDSDRRWEKWRRTGNTWISSWSSSPGWKVSHGVQ